MASQFQPLGEVPYGAVPIVRAIAATGTIYTPAAGRIFHLTACWATSGGSTTSGSVSINAQPRYDASSRVVLASIVGTSATGAVGTPAALATLDIPVEPNTAITLTSAGLTGGTVAGGICGWEEVQSR